jgi:hypothetical protein
MAWLVGSDLMKGRLGIGISISFECAQGHFFDQIPRMERIGRYLMFRKGHADPDPFCCSAWLAYRNRLKCMVFGSTSKDRIAQYWPKPEAWVNA